MSNPMKIRYDKDRKREKRGEGMAEEKKDEFEPIGEEELIELVLEAQKEALEKARLERLARLSGVKPRPKKQPPFVRLIVWLIAGMMAFSTFAFIFEIYSIPAVEFVKVSAKLSTREDIQSYKKAVVEVSTGESKGTGFTISSDGLIVTNDHVVDDALTLTIIFPDDGMYKAEVVESYPDIDLALLKIDGEDLPYLQLAESFEVTTDEAVHFIGNPLSFTGIANEGRLLESTRLSDWENNVYMMDAPVYKGNSGSPVINYNGLVIGIVFATIKDDEYGHVGLFVPVDLLINRLPNSATN